MRSMEMRKWAIVGVVERIFDEAMVGSVRTVKVAVRMDDGGMGYFTASGEQMRLLRRWGEGQRVWIRFKLVGSSSADGKRYYNNLWISRVEQWRTPARSRIVKWWRGLVRWMR